MCVLRLWSYGIMLCSFTGGYQYFGVSFCLPCIVEVKYTLNMGAAAGLSAMFVTTFKSAWWYNPEDIALTLTAIKN